MGWDFTATPYDEGAWRTIEAQVAQGSAEVHDAERLLVRGAVRGPGVFLGRSYTLSAMARLADPPLRAVLGAVADAVDPLLSRPDGDVEGQRHRWAPRFVEEIAAHAERLDVPALSAAEVDALMAASRAAQPMTGPGAELADDHPAVRATGRPAAEVRALLGLDAPGPLRRLLGAEAAYPPFHFTLLLGLTRSVAGTGHGLVLSHDGLGRW